MKVYVIGGTTVRMGSPGFADEIQVLEGTMGALGRELCFQGHEAVVCSPFPDSADYHLLHAIANCRPDLRPSINVYYPELEVVDRALKSLLEKLNFGNIRRFPCQTPGEPGEAEALQYAWLFAQLTAMDASAAVIVVGGKPSGSLNLLLSLADAKDRSVLPLTFLGGAARDYYSANYWRLRDLIPNDLPVLGDPARVASVPRLLETLRTGTQADAEKSFFISYARVRPQEADYVETLLRRRDHIVYRDEEEFEPSADTQAEIVRNIKRAGVFVALWCKDYACSPWCFVELEIGLERHANGLAELWIFCLDETRIVPKAARTLNYYPANSREKLEAKVLFLLTKLDERATEQGGAADAAKRRG